MMRAIRCLWVLTALGWGMNGWAGVTLSIQPAKILGFWNFVESIAGTGNLPSEILRDVFNQSQYSKDARILTALENFKRIRNSQFNQGYHFAEYPEPRREMGWDVSRHFRYQASQSRDLKDLRSRTTQVLSAADHSALFQALSPLEPVYDQLIWRKYNARLAGYGTKILKTWKRGELSKLYDKTLRFYRSEGAENRHFTIHLMPIPASRGHSSATVIEDAILLDAMLDEKDIPGRVAVVFHEMAHASYQAQSSETQKSLDRWFSENKSRFSDFAKSLLDEGLATAIGNGLAFKSITGQEDSSSWYEDDEIETGAKAEFEWVQSYVNAGKPMDPEFVNRWISIYERTFSKAFQSVQKQVKTTVLLADGKVMRSSEARPALKKAFTIGSLYAGSPISDPESIKILHEAGDRSAIVLVVSSGELKQLGALEGMLPEGLRLRKFIDKMPHSAVAAGLAGDRALMVFKVETQAEYSALMSKISDLKELPVELKIIAELSP